jgi:broad specificity phosphatase PhoE
MTRVYLIRHCESLGNIERIFHGITDVDISENGKKQLDRLRERCRDFKFDAIYSSPLIRAYKTAEAANYYHGLPIITDEGLLEQNGGHWEDKKFEELPVLFPEEFRRWEEEPGMFCPEGGEPMREVYDRIWNTVLAIVKRHPGQNVCIVSHGCAIKNFLCRAYRRPIEMLSTVGWYDNTAISVVDFDEDLSPTVVATRDASHLDEETSTFSKQDWWKKFEPGGVNE